MWRSCIWKTLWCTILWRLSWFLQTQHSTVSSKRNLPQQYHCNRKMHIQTYQWFPFAWLHFSRNLEYTCKEGGKCVVDVSRRNQCQACRFAKCLAANMRPEGNKWFLLCLLYYTLDTLDIYVNIYRYITLKDKEILRHQYYAHIHWVRTSAYFSCLYFVASLVCDVYGMKHFRNQKFNICVIKKCSKVEAWKMAHSCDHVVIDTSTKAPHKREIFR